MLKLDPYSDGLLFQCDRCQHVGELITHMIEEEGQFYCWSCLKEMKSRKHEGKAMKVGNYAIK